MKRVLLWSMKVNGYSDAQQRMMSSEIGRRPLLRSTE
jgi:hypothetical protein